MNTEIKVYLRKNATDTAAQAPYTWGVIPNGVANLNDLVADILGNLNSSEERVRMTIRETVKVALEHALAGETVDIGSLRLKPRIPGSMPYEDSPFDPERDEVIVDVYADAELADAFDGVTPTKVSAEEFAAAIKVSNVMDVATEAFGEIRGSADFEVLGNGLTLDGEGEGVKLLDRKTDAVLAAAEVDSVSKGQRATCHFAAVEGGVDKGAYTLELTTFGLVGDTKPHVFRKPVTLVEAVPAPPEPLVKSSDGFVKVMSIDEDPIPALDSFTVRGENVGYKSDTDHGLMGANATVGGKTLSWHSTESEDDRAPQATFESDATDDPPDPGEYTAALTLSYAVDDGTGVTHLESLVIENVRFTVSE